MAGVVEFDEVTPPRSLKVGKGFKLADVDPDSTPGYPGSKADGELLLEELDAKLADLQEKLFAESKFGGTKRVLLILQAMDTAGKGGIVKHVMGAMDPQGVQFKSFKAPTPEEKSYDFLWRIEKEVPGGRHAGGLRPVPLRGCPDPPGPPLGRPEGAGAPLRGPSTNSKPGRRRWAPRSSRSCCTSAVTSRRSGCWPGWTIRPSTGSTAART